MIEVWPVIHVQHREQALECAGIADFCKCAGVMIISMSGEDEKLDPIGDAIRETFPNLKLGVNYLTMAAPYALLRSQRNGYDATWTDQQMFSAGSMNGDARAILLVKKEGHKLFAAVAFKGQSVDPFPGDSAQVAALNGMIPTTSGTGTGYAPAFDKITSIRRHLHPSEPLAIASGISPDNIAEFLPFVSHVLVATGISKDFHHFDEAKLRLLMERTR